MVDSDSPMQNAVVKPTESSTAALRLERLLRSNSCITYHEGLPDREYPRVKCSIYGAPKTNELFVKVFNRKVSFVGVAPSPVASPAMADRIFGIDEADQVVAFALADHLWEEHHYELVRHAADRGAKGRLCPTSTSS